VSNAVLRSVGEHGAVSAPPSTRQGRDNHTQRAERARGRFVRWIGPALALTLSAVALVFLQRELAAYNYRIIKRAVAAIPPHSVALALATTAVCYGVLFWYDWLALRYVGRKLALHRTALASFIAYAFSQGLGVSALTGASVRFRFWSAWGLSGGEIAEGVAFTTTTFWLGALTVAGVALLASNGQAGVSPIPIGHRAWLGTVLILPVLAYFAWVLRAKGPRPTGRWTLRPPRARLAAAQIAIASLDWSLAGVVLYVLLPHDIGLTLAGFLGAYLVAQVAGLVSHMPGGIGVFDTIMLVVLKPFVPTAQLAAALVAYRAIYYLVPLGAASLAFATYELVPRRRVVARAMRVVARAIAASAPYWLSGATFAAGLVLLASGSTPSIHSRLRWLDDLLPLAVIEISHFTASVVGVVLLLVANGLRRRLDAAWHVAVALLAVGIGASLLKGGDYEEAITLAIVLAAIVPARRHFYRRAAILAEPLSPGWIVAVLLAVVGTTWLGFFSFEHMAERADEWWRFATTADAPRFLRATVGVAVALIGYALARLFRPMRVRAVLPAPEDLERAREIVQSARTGEAFLSLMGDKAMLFSKSGRGFLMYGVHRGVWVALGDPVASPEESRELAWRFCELADAHGGRPVFYEVGADELPMYVDLGLSLIKLGEEARVPLPSFSLEGGGRKGLRRVLRDADKAGLTLEVVQPPFPPALWEEIAAVSNAWLEGRRTREKGFSLGFFDPDYLKHFPLALIRHEGRVTAFANVWMTGGREELSVDLMRQLPETPPGAMDFLFLTLMLWGREHGFSWFNLGMAPLSGFETRALAPLWSRLGGLVYRHGEHFYNFRGLRQYKDKFDPVWTPRYLASPGGWSLPVVLTSVAALIGGGLKGVVAK
jgi:phosphatidylglycerol lysyltransferase